MFQNLRNMVSCASAHENSCRWTPTAISASKTLRSKWSIEQFKRKNSTAVKLQNTRWKKTTAREWYLETKNHRKCKNAYQRKKQMFEMCFDLINKLRGFCCSNRVLSFTPTVWIFWIQISFGSTCSADVDPSTSGTHSPKKSDAHDALETSQLLSPLENALASLSTSYNEERCASSDISPHSGIHHSAQTTAFFNKLSSWPINSISSIKTSLSIPGCF